MAEWIKNRFKINEILKFLVGGGSAVLVDALTYALLKQFLNISASKAISYIAGAIIGFIINKLWTFNRRQFNISEVFKYITLYAVSALINSYVNKLVLKIISSTVFAFMCATGVSTIINFLGQKFFVFNKKENK